MNENEAVVICSYIDTFYVFIPWLRLNGIDYYLREPELTNYNNGLEIVILKGKTKQQRRLVYQYLNVEVPKIKKKIYKRRANYELLN